MKRIFCRSSLLFLSTLMGGTLMAAPASAQKPLDQVQHIRKTIADFRDSLTLEEAAQGDKLKMLEATVNREVGVLRNTLAETFGRIPEGVSVLKYLPSAPVLDGSVDYRQEIQQALDENVCVVLTGNQSPATPNRYGVSCGNSKRQGLIVPAGHILMGEPGSMIRRLPSVGPVVVLERGAQAVGVTVDGNKQAHGTADLVDKVGKAGGAAFLCKDQAVVRDCLAFDVPGIGFMTYGRGALFWRCRARNCGVIDLKYNADYYQGKWDNWSGDGFYIRGFGSLVMDCEARDCFRWGYTTCHEGAGAATYIACTMSNQLWRTYGFIDIEGCRDDREGTVLIGMKAPEGKTRKVSVSSEKTVVLDCVMESLSAPNANNLLVADCTMIGGGLGLGGWSSVKNAWVRGGVRPIIIGNTIVKEQPESGIVGVSDWSFSVFSTGNGGIVANNTLKEYEGPGGKGLGMKLDKVAATNNTTLYGVWMRDPIARASATANAAQTELKQQRLRDFAVRAIDLATKLGVRGEVTRLVMLSPDALFAKDPGNVGEREMWGQKTNRAAAGKLTSIQLGDHWEKQIGKYEGHGWYFSKFQVSGDDFHVCDTVNLLFGGVGGECRVYINGTLVGENKKPNEPFLVALPHVFDGLVHWDDKAVNDVAIHVHAPGGQGGVYEHAALVLTQTPSASKSKPATGRK